MIVVRTLIAAAALAAPLLVVGCGETTVNRTDPNAVRDLSGNWNATDSQELAAKIIADVTSDPWIEQFRTKYNRDPVIKVGSVKNKTDEDISTPIFTNDIRRALRKTGKVKVVASNDETSQARDERKDQDINSSAESRHESFQETGADMLLEGAINIQHDRAGSEAQKFYSSELLLTDVKTQEIVWEGNDKIAKDVNRSKYK